jgi:hypothetical protein
MDHRTYNGYWEFYAVEPTRTTPSETNCWERVSCPRFEAHELSELFAICSGDRGFVGSWYCGRRT